MATPLPDPRSLLGALLGLESTLTTFQNGRAALSFAKTSSDGTVTVTTNGLGNVVSVSIAPAQLSQDLQTLANKVRDTANAAIDAAATSSSAASTTFASSLGLPALPAQGALPPAYPDFVLLADSITEQILANNPCQSTETFTCQAGRVTAVIDAHRRCLTLTYAAPPPHSVHYLETRTVEALNCAIDKGTRRTTDTGGATGGITDSFGMLQLVLYAKGDLILDDRVKIKTVGCADFATVANFGNGQTNIGVQAEVANIVSRASVTVRDHGIVHGFIHTSGTFTPGANVQITGPIEQNAVVVLPDLTLNVPFPGVTQGTVEIEPNQQQTAGPGFYNQLAVKQGAVAKLSAGAYYFNDITLEPGSQVSLDASGGPVIIWARNSFTFRGAFVDKAGGFPRVLVGYLGTAMAVVESKYQGTLAAPNAKISISTIQSHEGAFHGHDIEVQPDCQICHHPFELRYDQLPGVLPPGGLPPPVVDLGFENVSGWSSPQQDLLTSVPNPVTQGTRSLQITNVAGPVDIVSANFSADLAPNGATRMVVDLWIPSNQPNPTNVGTMSATISVPSAGVNAVSLGSVALTSLPRNQFDQVELALPTAVRTALDGTHSDVSLKLTLNVTASSGPWYIDNVRFLLPPQALTTLDPILSFEDITKWSCAQVALTTSTTTKTNLTRALRVTTAPGRMVIVSVPFASGPISAPTGKFRIDLWIPSNQAGSTWHGQFQLQVDIPSASVVAATTSIVELTPLPTNVFSTIELALPANVATAINGEYSDVKLTLILNVVTNSGPWHMDFMRFV
jgi:DNA-binding protein YbaB